MPSLNETPSANRLHIAFFGRTNSGKSTLINTLTGQNVSLVSPVSGTTTDPVSKAMELLPIGPVLLIDTAGLDDESELGALRIKRSLEVGGKTDLAVLVVPSTQADLTLEREFAERFKASNTPVILICNRMNGGEPQFNAGALGLPFFALDARDPAAMQDFKQFIVEHADFEFESPSLCGGLVGAGDVVVLVMPQNIQAPKGRLILPQVQVTRDLLDLKCRVVSVLADDLAPTLNLLKEPPALVITDSQVFPAVNKVLPQEIPLTSFSILMAKFKGDIHAMVSGARAIAGLAPGDKVLILEACTHHAMKGDIAREKLPNALKKYVGGELQIDVFSGPGLPENLNDYKLAVHCGGCMLGRKAMLTRHGLAEQKGVPMTNFGVALAFLGGMLERVTY